MPPSSKKTHFSDKQNSEPMKRTYIKPAIRIITVNAQEMVLASGYTGEARTKAATNEMGNGIKTDEMSDKFHVSSDLWKYYTDIQEESLWEMRE